MLSGDKPSNTRQRNEVKEAMYRPADILDEALALLRSRRKSGDLIF